MRNFLKKVKWRFQKTRTKMQLSAGRKKMRKSLSKVLATREKVLKNWPIKHQNYCHTCWKRLPGESIDLISWICPECAKDLPTTIKGITE